MNREGYRDPTAERAVKNVSSREVTKGKLIRHCRSRPQSYSCDRCEFDVECGAFIRESGHVPYSMDLQSLSADYLEEVVIVKRKNRKKG